MMDATRLDPKRRATWGVQRTGYHGQGAGGAAVCRDPRDRSGAAHDLRAATDAGMFSDLAARQAVSLSSEVAANEGASAATIDEAVEDRSVARVACLSCRSKEAP
jgi:adenosylmethionine-8-amino-7-oxononanoate aminotransferase